MYIATDVIITAGFTAFLCTIGLICAAAVLIKKKRLAAFPFFLGIMLGVVSELLAVRFLMSWAQMTDWYAAAQECVQLRLALYSLPPAVIGEGLRLFLMKRLMKTKREKFHADSLGMGSGFCGIMISTGIFIAGNFVLMLMIRGGSFFDTIYMNISDNEMSLIREQMIGFTIGGILWLLPSAAAKCILHVACSELMLLYVRRDKYGFALSAAAFRAVWEAVTHTGLRVWLETLVLLALSCAVLLYVRKYAQRRINFGNM